MDWRIKIDNYLYSLNDMCYLSLDYFSEDLDDCNNWSIAKIATVNYIGDIFRYYKNEKDIECISGFEIIWERKDNNLVNIIEEANVTNIQEIIDAIN